MNPTALMYGPYRFGFFSQDGHEPPHVHVFRDDREAKVWLNNLSVEVNDGFSQRELNEIVRIIQANLETIQEKWRGHFGSYS